MLSDQTWTLGQALSPVWDPVVCAVLLVTRDEPFLFRTANALQQYGFEVFTAHSPAIADHTVRRRPNVRAVVIDAKILGPISRERPGPILRASPGISVVVARVSLLDASRRAVIASYQATCVEDGDDRHALIRAVEELLLAPHHS
jgi:ActR/RegA family two-component response regulator